MKKTIRRICVYSTIIVGALVSGCAKDNVVGPVDDSPWQIQKTDHGILAIQGDWIVSAKSGQWPANPDSGLSAPGLDVLYKVELVGGGGLYDIKADGKTWNERVPFIQVARPSYSIFEGYSLNGKTISFSFADTTAAQSDPAFPQITRPLRLNVDIILENNALAISLKGMYLVFPSVRDTLTLKCSSANKDTVLVVALRAQHWAWEFSGPANYQSSDAHYQMQFDTDAPLMKLDIGSWPPGDFLFFNFDHSLIATPPRDSVNTQITVIPRF